MSDHEQQSFFPPEQQVTEPPVDVAAMAEHIAANARPVEYEDRTSEAARDQGFGRDRLPLGIERPSEEDASPVAASPKEPEQTRQLVEPLDLTEPAPAKPKRLTSAQKNANYRRHLAEHMRVVGPSKQKIERNYG